MTQYELLHTKNKILFSQTQRFTLLWLLFVSSPCYFSPWLVISRKQFWPTNQINLFAFYTSQKTFLRMTSFILTVKFETNKMFDSQWQVIWRRGLFHRMQTNINFQLRVYWLTGFSEKAFMICFINILILTTYFHIKFLIPCNHYLWNWYHYWQHFWEKT